MDTAELSRRAAERIRKLYENSEYRREARLKEAISVSEWNEHMANLNRYQARSVLNDTTRYYG